MKAARAAGSWRSLALVAAVCALLAACSQSQVLDKVTSPEDRALGATVVGDLQRPDGDADLIAQLDPRLRDSFAKILPQIRSLTPSGPGAVTRLVDGRFQVTNTLNGGVTRQAYLGYEVSNGPKRALIRMVILRRNGMAQIESLYLNPLYKPLEQINGFGLSGKSFAQYLVLILTVLSFSLCLGSEILLFMTRGVRRKWLWAIGCLLGLGQISIDWSSGAWGFSPLYVQFLGAYAAKTGMLEPWRVGFGVPVFAIIFLLRRGQLQGSARQIDERVFSE